MYLPHHPLWRPPVMNHFPAIGTFQDQGQCAWGFRNYTRQIFEYSGISLCNINILFPQLPKYLIRLGIKNMVTWPNNMSRCTNKKFLVKFRENVRAFQEKGNSSTWVLFLHETTTLYKVQGKFSCGYELTNILRRKFLQHILVQFLKNRNIATHWVISNWYFKNDIL